MPVMPAQHNPRPKNGIRSHDADRAARRAREKTETYDADWRSLRRRFLLAHPVCMTEGCGKDATDVDHIASVRSTPGRRLDWSNLRAYCHSCHSRRTAFDQGGWQNE